MLNTRHSLVRANRVAILAWMALVLLIGGLTWSRIVANVGFRNETHDTERVLQNIKDLQIALRDVETGQRGYLLTGEASYLAPYDQSAGLVAALEATLRHMTEGDVRQQEQLRALMPLVRHKLDELADTVRLRRDSGLPAALAIVRTDAGRQDQVGIDALLRTMSTAEQDRLARRVQLGSHRNMVLNDLALAGVVSAILALIWAARTLNAAWLRASALEEEQRSLAERLRASLDSLSQGIAVFDAGHLLTNWNHCFQALLGLQPEIVQGGTPYAALARQVAPMGAASGELLEHDEQIRSDSARVRGEAVTYERILPNGRHLEFRRTTMPDGGFVLTISDMTQRVQSEALLREAQKMQAIGQLTGGIAHDFNNLLTVILGNLEVAQKRLPEDHFLQSRLGRAVWASQRGATLTTQLLAFARKQPLAPAAIDLSHTIPDMLPLLARTLGAPIDVRFVPGPDLWPAMADPAQFESALLNLALNARDAMPDGGHLTLELSNKVLDDAYASSHYEVMAGDYVMLAVSDTGTGMTPEIAARVFEPFFTTKPDGKGTGLGLAMVFGFVKQTKGHVKIYSEPGEGTTVRMYLPRAMDAMPGVLPQPAIAAGRARGNATVLVVEDEAGVREVAVGILRDYGYRVFEAADGDAAVRLFEDHASEIDLLLTDVVLPGTLRGRDVAERALRLRPEVRVLFMSGYTENSIVHQGRLDAGVQLIGKPFNREQLAARVAGVLGDASLAQVRAPDRVG